MSYLWVAVGQAQARGRLRELADDSDKNWIATPKGRKRKRPDGTWQYDYTKPGTGKKAAAKPVGAKPATSRKPAPQKAGSKTVKKVETPKKTARKAVKKGAAFATPEVVNASLDFVKRLTEEKRVNDVHFGDLYRHLKQEHPSASVEDFRHLVVALARSGKIRLGSWSGSLDRLRDPELAFFIPDGSGREGFGKYFADMHLVDGRYSPPNPNSGGEYPEGPPELSPFQKQELQKKAAVAKKPTPNAGSKTMKKEGAGSDTATGKADQLIKQVKDLFDVVHEQTVGFGAIDEISEAIGRLPAAEAVRVATSFGLRLRKGASRAEAVRQIKRKLTEQKGSANRIAVI